MCVLIPDLSIGHQQNAKESSNQHFFFIIIFYLRLLFKFKELIINVKKIPFELKTETFELLEFLDFIFRILFSRV